MPGIKAPEEERREQILRAAFAVAVRDGLDGLTVRAVAAQAGLSFGLVPYHFQNKQALLGALLDWLLDTSALANPQAAIAHIADPAERLLALVRHEVERASREADRTSLFFDYWVRGVRQPGLRARIRTELERYRGTFRTLAAAAIGAPSDGRTPRGARRRAEDVAALAVAIVEGCAVQSVISPQDLDVHATAVAAEAVLATLIAPATQADRAPGVRVAPRRGAFNSEPAPAARPAPSARRARRSGARRRFRMGVRGGPMGFSGDRASGAGFTRFPTARRPRHPGAR